ncbi:T6SS phospholipase effector Tle1-like catalytic domain-containing protein [Frateuria sp.]|uniref:T6SS phospholipase effector Tle1-like catalytic domain-containing protein n=1 Tax=Frateuria sp. TaxID=2211372 RepID=UPI003F81ADBD
MSNDPSRWPDGVEVRQAGKEALEGYALRRQQLSRFGAPLLVGTDSPHSRLYMADFDGTGNDKYQDPAHATNVARIYDQVNEAKNTNIRAGYVPGVGTQIGDFEKNLDGAVGYSYGPRLEEMYLLFINQARAWRAEDPDAVISLASIGFSRGAVTAAMFARMVEERGIQDPADMIIERDDEGRIISLTPTRPPLVPPGQTPQVVGLFDPVATGVMNKVDVRLPPSVISGFQITALDERRDEFASKQIIDPGMSANGRFFNARVNGAHCDIGGSYLLNGLSVRNGNMMVAYLNALSDVPFLQEQAVPNAPAMNVIHRSEQHQWFYTTAMDATLGHRTTVDRLVAPISPDPVVNELQSLFANTRDAEPMNEALDARFRHRFVPVPPEREESALPAFFETRPRAPAPPPPTKVDWNQMFLQMSDAALDRNAHGVLESGRQFTQTTEGQIWLQQGLLADQATRVQAAQAAMASIQATQSPGMRA